VQTERFCTACGIRVRAEASHLRATICLAGHPLPLLMHADGRVEQIGEAGTLLGSFADPELHDTTVDVMAGEALVAFTDGLVERRTLEIDEGERRLADLLSTCRDLSSARIVERIERELLGGDDLDDDVAVVVIAKR
jgi:serine phosphatase RsbU (regulator of sigma subunit)